MTKPFSNAEMLEAVRALCGRHERAARAAARSAPLVSSRGAATGGGGMMDAARLLPVLGRCSCSRCRCSGRAGGGRAAERSRALIYLFAVWVVLIVAGGADRLRRCTGDGDDADAREDAAPERDGGG